MALDETQLSKGQVRKLNALRKSIGDSLAEEVFAKWLRREETGKLGEDADPVAEEIRKALEPLATEQNLSFGRYGYAVKRAKGRAKEVIQVEKIQPE